MLYYFVFILCVLSSAYCDHDTKQEVVSEYQNELISVDLKKKNSTEDVKLIVQLRIHLINGKVHCNGNPLKHGSVHAVHMRINIIEIANGVKKDARMAPVLVRIMVLEDLMKKTLLVEEEFITVDGYEVSQIVVKQVQWTSMARKVSDVPMTKCQIHKRNTHDDHHVYYGVPHLPEHGLKAGNDDCDEEDEHHHKHHHHHHGRHHHHRCHHRHHEKVKCWYKHLSTKSKICLFATGFLGLMACVVCCSIIAKKRQSRRMNVQIAAPMDDTVNVADEKKMNKDDGEKFDFHFEFDNTVVVDDKKGLI